MTEPEKVSADDDLLFDTVLLELRAVAAQLRVAPSVAALMDLQAHRDAVVGDLIFRLRAYVLSQHLDRHTETASQEVEFRVPASWWQHYKRDVLARHRLTRWFVRWRPARTEVHTRTATLTASWEQYATFPESEIVVDPKLGQYRLNVLKHPPAWRVTP